MMSPVERPRCHAYKEDEEFIVALFGSFDVVLNDGKERKVYSWNRSYYGLYVLKMYWREMENFSTNSLALVLSSTDYDQFLNARIHPINTAVIPEIFRIGFSPVYLPYERPIGLNEGKSRWTFKKKLRLGKDVFFSSSSFPIKFITNLGFWTAVISVLVLIFYGYIALFGNRQFWGVTVPGWVSIILFITFFGGLILLSLGIIAEYIWRIYEEVKGRPGYIIKKK